jgi:hypothetical protein
MSPLLVYLGGINSGMLILMLILSQLICMLTHVHLIKMVKNRNTYFHYLGRTKDFVAHRAFLPLSPLVDSKMLVEISLLCKTLVATRFFAFEWSLTCVDSQMVEEIMPLSEKHVAPAVITFKKFHISLGPWIFVFIHTEFPCVRNLFINFDRVKVEVIPLLDKNLRTKWYLIPYFCISNLVAGYPNSPITHAKVFIVHEA